MASPEFVPRIRRSGQLKSSTAHPSVKNMGCETIVACRPMSLMAFSRAFAVPTGTGVTMVRIGGFGAKDNAGSAGERFNVGGVRKTASADIAADNFFEILLEKRDISLGHFHHA